MSTFLKISITFLLLGVSLGGKTPKNFENVFKDKCEEIIRNGKATCSSAWTEFSKAFSDKSPSEVKAGDYENYFAKLPIGSIDESFLFWSQTEEYVKAISANNLGAVVISSFTTPSAKIINDLGDPSWCGSKKNGIDYDCDCNDTPKTQFWKQFSIKFAEAAKGIAFYLGTNRRGGAYWDGTSFARYEIPNLNHEVTKVVAIVLNENTEGETCTQPRAGSLSLLQQKLPPGVTYDCYFLTGEKEYYAKCAARLIAAVNNSGAAPKVINCPNYLNIHDEA